MSSTASTSVDEGSAAPPMRIERIEENANEKGEALSSIDKSTTGWPLRDISYPHSNDVLFVKLGDRSGERLGNSFWKMLVNSHKDLCEQNRDKLVEVSRIVVQRVRNQTPPGRFLRMDQQTFRWYDVGNEMAEWMTRMAFSPEPTATIGQLPTHWCQVCSVDLQSAQNLQQHERGRKHRNRLAMEWQNEATHPWRCEPCDRAFASLQALTDHRLGKKHRKKANSQAGEDATVKPYRCGKCKKGFDTPAERQGHVCIPTPVNQTKASVQRANNQSALREPGSLAQRPGTLSKTDQPKFQFVKKPHWCTLCQVCFDTIGARQEHYDFDPEHAKNDYRHRGISFVAEEVDAAYRQMAIQRRNADIGADVDYSKMNDEARMWQEEFDDVVVELAMYNYETFHKMEHGTVDYTTVYRTSAGIQGWAACTFDDVKPAAAESNEEEGTDEIEDTKLPPATKAARGDEEENRMLRLAMMESMLESKGVCPPCLAEDDDKSFRYDEVYDSSDDDEPFEYDDDYGSDEEEEEDCESLVECSDEYNNDDHVSDCDSEETNSYEEVCGGGRSESASDESWSQISDGNSTDESKLSDPVLVEEDDVCSRDSSSSDFSVVDFLE